MAVEVSCVGSNGGMVTDSDLSRFTEQCYKGVGGFLKDARPFSVVNSQICNQMDE